MPLYSDIVLYNGKQVYCFRISDGTNVLGWSFHTHNRTQENNKDKEPETLYFKLATQ